MVKIEDYTIEVMNALDSTADIALEAAAGELESAVKRKSRRDTGQTAGSFRHHVSPESHTAHIGSNDENAIWEEFGTGEHALNGGRKGAWYVPVDAVHGRKKPSYNGKVIVVYGKNGKKFYKTNGKQPSRAFFKSYTEKKPALIKLIQSYFKGL